MTTQDTKTLSYAVPQVEFEDRIPVLFNVKEV